MKDKTAILMQEPRTIAKITTKLNEGEKAFIKEETDLWIQDTTT